MDEHDSAFDGAMEYDEEDGRSLLGEEFDAGSDVAVEVQENKKDKRRREFQDRLLKLELEFEENKQTIFSYQMARYKEEMNAILNGSHPDFHDQLEDLADAREATITGARLYRDYQFKCAQDAYDVETQLAEEEYKGEREGLREKMLAIIDSKRRALREDKENLDITNDFALEPTSRTHHTRKLRKRGQEAEVGAKNNKRKTAAPPAPKWLAVDADVMDDIGAIRKALVPAGTIKKTGTVKKK
ncbi:Breast cancer metastasis-suppressor 1 [Gryganskiella cystojenkinii]|nr:Breast cancer metastasis-suppressor 1 [Gryganskiella cystojenkinii]